MNLLENINKQLYWAAIIAIALLLVSVWMNVWQILTPKDFVNANCNSFGSYADILVSFHNGNRGLDGNGDGIPCNNRK